MISFSITFVKSNHEDGALEEAINFLSIEGLQVVSKISRKIVINYRKWDVNSLITALF